MHDRTPRYAIVCAAAVALAYVVMLVIIAVVPDLFAKTIAGLNVGRWSVIALHTLPVGLAWVYLRRAKSS
jgi:uncharacterized membrane protein (DUF485 family)